jgi:myo-inositol-1(or 4)-monophosphatase
MNRVDSCFQLACEAAAMLRDRVGRSRVDYKGERDPVTEADLASESFLRDELLKRFPGDGFLGEEGSSESSRSGWLWVADPLDGTVNFAHGDPNFCVSLGLLRDGLPVLGAVVSASGMEPFHAERGAGAFRGDKRLRVSSVSNLFEAIISTDFPYDVEARTGRGVDRLRALLATCQAVRIRGSCALELCRAASGELEAFFGDGTHAWDLAAGVVILEEAGGRATDWWGRPLDLLSDARWPMATNGILHAEALALASEFA